MASGKGKRRGPATSRLRFLRALLDVGNWYAAAMVVLAAGLLDYLITGIRMPYYQVYMGTLGQSLMATVILAIFVGLGVYFAALARRAAKASSEGMALAYAAASASLLVVWYVVALAIGGLIR